MLSTVSLFNSGNVSKDTASYYTCPHCFCENLHGHALATEFCAYWKKFLRARVQTTSFSGTDISTTLNIYKPLKFRRENLNHSRQDVFTRHEANGPESQFYELIQGRMCTRRILYWLEDIKSFYHNP